VRCLSCGSENEVGRKFCGECGSALARLCSACGAPNGSTVKFCGECGAPLSADTVRTATTAPAMAPGPREVPAEQRRLVSVLFVDLVGFTTLSESRDAEEVRGLLSRYFDTCTKLIGRYGGVVEKFIGDAVMAVWGSPVATEDDAERAVRAALDLVAAVTAFGTEVGAPDLRARAGVLTGEAAVDTRAEAEGMVVGDMVNTASRIQSAAEPGTVLVGESTRWATDAAIAYEDAGTQEMKGKAEPLPLWRAVRVVSGARGEQKVAGLEAAFVGRDRELRLVKESFHASADESLAHLVSVTGSAGIGKSRLAWEFYKYFNGLVETVNWHRGRCPSYGDGVTYWALAEMVKMRCEIAEDETGSTVLAKLRGLLEAEMPDVEERRWVEPRVATLLGLEDGAAGDRDELFSAWRLFFERLADRHPTVMVFEDIQWADTSLLDFIEYLLEWSRNSRLFIVTLGRPELAERRPNWGTGKRNFTSLYLEPLSEQQMHELIAGLIPGLPKEVEHRILDRAQGVPLYALETVRMLLDRGLLVEEGSAYRPTGPIDDLDVPETLHALIAARLDGLDPQERLVVQDGSVLGKTFFEEGVAAVSGLAEAELGPILTALVRKELLSFQSDPRSPERGQYSFLQDLVRQVAYNTISKKERKTKHVAAASFIRETWQGDEDEVVEVVASHYLQAYELDPGSDDAAQIRSAARGMFEKAGGRAASLGANLEAQHYFRQAGELSEPGIERISMIERAGKMALVGARLDEANALLNEALEGYESIGETHPAARVTAQIAQSVWAEGHLDEATERLRRAYAVLSEDEPDEDLATLAAMLGRAHYFQGEFALSAARLDEALDIAERLVFPEVTSQALNSKSLIASDRSRPQESLALVGHALKIAVEHDLSEPALRAYFNMADQLYRIDRYEAALDVYEQGLALARRIGNRLWLQYLLCDVPIPLFLMGRWDDALTRLDEVQGGEEAINDVVGPVVISPLIHGNRGAPDSAAGVFTTYARYEQSGDVQEAAAFAAGRAAFLNSKGQHEDALTAAGRALDLSEKTGDTSFMTKVGLAEAVDAALMMGDLNRVRSLIERGDRLTSIKLSPVTRALVDRAKARLAVAAGEKEGVEALFGGAAGLFRECGVPFWLAATLTEQGEWYRAQGRDAAGISLLEEARAIFDSLGAVKWLERLDHAAAEAPAST
jgi:class 3 adenylate cyclase/tetratricopeptide (TPR) repeat protein